MLSLRCLSLVGLREVQEHTMRYSQPMHVTPELVFVRRTEPLDVLYLDNHLAVDEEVAFLCAHRVLTLYLQTIRW